MFKGPLVFRERKPGVLFLRRQLIYNPTTWRKPLFCRFCQASLCSGEIDVTFGSDFYCSDCTTRFYSQPLHVKCLVKSAWEAVWTLVGAAVCYQNDLSKEIFFYVGQELAQIHKGKPKMSSYLLPQQCIDFYASVKKNAKQSIDMLGLCLMRLKFYKDLRQLICKMCDIVDWLE